MFKYVKINILNNYLIFFYGFQNQNENNPVNALITF